MIILLFETKDVSHFYINMSSVIKQNKKIVEVNLYELIRLVFL